MKAAIRVLLIPLALILGSAHASVITFNDIDASFGDVSLDAMSPYAGFTWTNFFAYTTEPGFPGYNNGIVSNPNGAYSGGDDFSGAPIVGEMQSASLFDFTSAYLGSGNYDNLSLTINGLKGGNTIYSQTLTLDTTGAQLFTFNFDNIDTLTFTAAATDTATDPYQCGSFDCSQFTIDNLTYSLVSEPPPTDTVPEPPTFALVAVALLAASMARKRKRAARS